MESIPLPADARLKETVGFDLLRVPLLGAALRRPLTRAIARAILFVLAAVMVLQGFFGTPLAPKNLATVVTWVHYRGVLVLVLLFLGNFFCMACPFMVARDLARRVLRPPLRWPRRLRNKWPAAVLFAGVLFAYELFDLWGNPWWTASLIAGYFGAAFVVDALFRHASFCKYLCPIGQFNFLSSMVSPLEVRVREPQACASCATLDCIRGSPEGSPVRRRGCEMALFQPRKVGNLDCTFCLDCVYACPHDNVGIVARLPGEEITESGFRSGIGRISRRPDLAAFGVLFSFGALLNAFGMVSPVYAVEGWLAGVMGVTVEWPVLGTLFVAALVVEPMVLLGLAAAFTRRASGRRESLIRVATRYSYALVPLGFGVWLSHYTFHFLTGALTVIPVTRNLLRNLGWTIVGAPDWRLAGLPAGTVYPIETGFISLGLLVSLGVAWRLAAADAGPRRRRRTFLPWALLLLLLAGTALWLLHQPMEMRGTMLRG
jgi:polyferredoxin